MNNGTMQGFEIAMKQYQRSYNTTELSSSLKSLCELRRLVTASSQPNRRRSKSAGSDTGIMSSPVPQAAAGIANGAASEEPLSLLQRSASGSTDQFRARSRSALSPLATDYRPPLPTASGPQNFADIVFLFSDPLVKHVNGVVQVGLSDK